MTISDRISDLLKKQNKSRKDLSDATGISYHTLTSLFQRQSDNMNLSTLQSIADFLNVPVEYLITGNTSRMLLKEQALLDHIPSSNDEKIIQELVNVTRKLNIKHKTILLAKAYELEDQERKD
jgi:transcriptional regulator with XRE-family HTH domain